LKLATKRNDILASALAGLPLVGLLFTVVTYFLALPLGFALFFTTPDGSSLSNSPAKGLPVELFMLANFVLPLRVSHGVIFAAALAVYVTCLVSAWNLGMSLPRALRSSLRGRLGDCSRNALLMLPLISSMLLVAILAVQKVQETSGVPTGSLKFPNEFSAFYALSYSPISEEIGFRLTPIGIFLVPYLLRRFRQIQPHARLRDEIRFSFVAFLLPDRSKGKVGLTSFASHGVRAVSSWEWALLILTSSIFGLAHYLSGAGWGIGKVSGTFLAGMTLGLVYILYGSHASILLHWFFNYYFTVYNLASGVYSGFFTQLAVAVESWSIALGIVGWALALLLVVRVSLAMSIRGLRAPRPPA